MNDKILDEKYLYLISPCGTGDTMLLCGLKQAIEDKYKKKVFYIIKPSHKCIMDMYGIKDYYVREYSHDELCELGEKHPIPEGGQLFPAHGQFINKGQYIREHVESKITFLQMTKKTVGLDDSAVLQMPINYPEISEELSEKIGGVDVDRVVLIAPEINLKDKQFQIDSLYFKKIIEDKEREGYKVVVNTVWGKYSELDDWRVDLTFEELIALSANCGMVVSARSGLCDLIFPKTKNMQVLYPNENYYELFNFKDLFGYERNEVTELIAPTYEYIKIRDIVENDLSKFDVDFFYVDTNEEFSGEIVCWGMGGCYRRNIEKVKEIYDVKCVCDNRSELWGSVTETGLRVISPEQLKEMKDVAVLVMVDNKDVYFSIALQAINLGIKRVWFVGERLMNKI